MPDDDPSPVNPTPSDKPEANNAGTDRRAFLKLAGQRAAYIAPAVATLAAASRANAASTTSPS